MKDSAELREGYLPGPMPLLDWCDLTQRLGLNDTTFDLIGRSGRRTSCRWLDPGLGLFLPDGADGFVSVKDLTGLGFVVENMQIAKPKPATPVNDAS